MDAGLQQQAIFFVTAIIASAINSVAGGGSFLLFPTLMLGGLPAVGANIMCAVGMWPGSVASSIAYWREIKIPIKEIRNLMLLSFLGGGIGAYILLHFPEETFAALVPWLLLSATVIFTFGRRVVAYLRLEHVHSNHKIIYVGMLIIAIYGGYFGAGMGILMLAMLQLAGHQNMHEMNGIKMVLSSGINVVALALFLVSGEVLWEWAGVLIAGGIVGGYVGTRLAVKVEPEKIRRMVVVIGFGMTAYFFYN